MGSPKSKAPARHLAIPPLISGPLANPAPAPTLPSGAASAALAAPQPVSGAPGQVNPRKRVRFSEPPVPAKRSRTAPAEPSTEVHLCEPLKALAQPRHQSAKDSYQAYQVDVLSRARKIQAPAAAKEVSALRIRSSLTAQSPATLGTRAHVLNCIDMTACADALRYGRIANASPQGLYRAALRHFHFQKLRQSLASDPVFSQQTPAMQADIEFLTAAHFNTSMGLGLFDFSQHTPQALQAGMQKARELGVNFAQIALAVLTVDPSEFFAYAGQKGSALKDNIFPESAEHEPTAQQLQHLCGVLTQGCPQGENADLYSDWFAQQDPAAVSRAQPPSPAPPHA
jgi:hypothetical protein